VRVRTGAWNTGWHHGRDFTQWTGSEAQKSALRAFALVSKAVHDARWQAGEQGIAEGPRAAAIEEALWHLLRAETSCNLYWGEDWVPRAESDLEAARTALTGIGVDVESVSTAPAAEAEAENSLPQTDTPHRSTPG